MRIIGSLFIFIYLNRRLIYRCNKHSIIKHIFFFSSMLSRSWSATAALMLVFPKKNEIRWHSLRLASGSIYSHSLPLISATSAPHCSSLEEEIHLCNGALDHRRSIHYIRGISKQLTPVYYTLWIIPHIDIIFQVNSRYFSFLIMMLTIITQGYGLHVFGITVYWIYIFLCNED